MDEVVINNLVKVPINRHLIRQTKDLKLSTLTDERADSILKHLGTSSVELFPSEENANEESCSSGSAKLLSDMLTEKRKDRWKGGPVQREAWLKEPILMPISPILEIEEVEEEEEEDVFLDAMEDEKDALDVETVSNQKIKLLENKIKSLELQVQSQKKIIDDQMKLIEEYEGKEFYRERKRTRTKAPGDNMQTEDIEMHEVDEAGDFGNIDAGQDVADATGFEVNMEAGTDVNVEAVGIDDGAIENAEKDLAKALSEAIKSCDPDLHRRWNRKVRGDWENASLRTKNEHVEPVFQICKKLCEVKGIEVNNVVGMILHR